MADQNSLGPDGSLEQWEANDQPEGIGTEPGLQPHWLSTSRLETAAEAAHRQGKRRHF